MLEYPPHSQKNKIITIKKKPFIAFFCTYTPQEIILASGFRPQRVIPLGFDPSLANTFLDSNFCPFVRSILSWAIKQNQDNAMVPFILVNSCDGMRRLYDVMSYYFRDSFIYFLDLPRKRDRASEELFKSYLYDLKRSLEDFTGREITDEALQEAIRESNNFRTIFMRLDEMRKKQNINLSYYDFFKLIQDGTEGIKKIYGLYPNDFLIYDSHLITNQNQLGEKKKTLRILLTGSVLDNIEIIKIIEEYGGIIELADHCNGWRYYINKIDETNPNKIDAIVSFYLHKISCPRMMESVTREERLLEIITDRKIDGVIFYTQKFCDVSLFQIPLLREKIKSLGVLSLCLEGEFSDNISGQVRTRIQAFMEAIEFG
jgi:benzoyl-CoA reductase subunit C